MIIIRIIRAVTPYCFKLQLTHHNLFKLEYDLLSLVVQPLFSHEILKCMYG